MKAYVRNGLTVSALILLAMGGMFAWAVYNLPVEGPFPLHWNARGVADRFGDRGDALAGLGLCVGVAALVSLLLAVMPSIDPRQRHIDSSRPAYLAVWIGVMALLAVVQGVITWMMVDTVANGPETISVQPLRWIMLGICALFILIGNFLPKTRSSWALGIRTPWTLSNETVWQRTHRLAGPLFMLAGLVGGAGALLAQGYWITIATLVPVLGVSLFAVAYSYIAYRQETADG